MVCLHRMTTSSEKLLRTRRAVGRTGRVFEGLTALSTINNLHTIHALMYETRALRTLEVGLSFGGSALVFCASHKELGRRPESQHTALGNNATEIGRRFHHDAIALPMLRGSEQIPRFVTQ
jgi:cephalosporin hydroxylase